MLQQSDSYRDFVLDAIERDGRLVLERDIYAQMGQVPTNTIVSVVRHNNGKYSVFRTFDLGESVATSVDMQDISAELVFEALFDRYSRRFA